MLIMAGKMDKSWEAESDANILKMAKKIIDDPSRFKAATKAAQNIANEAQKQVASLKALGGTISKSKTPRTRKK